MNIPLILYFCRLLNRMKMDERIVKFIKKHRSRNIASFKVVTNSDTFIITTEDCEQTEES